MKDDGLFLEADLADAVQVGAAKLAMVEPQPAELTPSRTRAASTTTRLNTPRRAAERSSGPSLLAGLARHPTAARLGFPSMSAETLIVVLAPSAVAIIVPWMTFRYALLREQRQWSREQRAQVYVDLLVEASAEQEWLQDELAQAGMGPDDRTPFPDHRMDDRERRRLGARVLAYGSQEVVRRHNRLAREGSWAISPLGGRDDAQRQSGRMLTELAFNALEAQIRLELEGEQGAPRWRRRPQVARDPLKEVPLPAFRREPQWAPPPEQGEEG